MADQPKRSGHVLTIIGIRPNGGASAPPPFPGRGTPGPSGPAADHPEPDDEAGEKVAPERALYSGPEETCGTCENWIEPNSCSEVDTITDRNGRCWSHYEPKQAAQPESAAGLPMMPLEQAS